MILTAMEKTLKPFLKKIPILNKLLMFLYQKRHQFKDHSYDVPSKWLQVLLKGDHIQIVQIGSNDGVTGDPIYDIVKNNIACKALFVEPIPYLFYKLKKNYGNDPRFTFENVAVNDGTQQIFYTVREEAKAELANLPPWYDQLGSFYKENILKHLNGILEPYIEEVVLTGVTLEELFKRNEIEEITLLHIDTEGYDWKILSQLNLSFIKPKIILIEHKHLDSIEKNSLIHFLKKDYVIFKLGGDMMGVSKTHEHIQVIKKLKGIPVR
jgi:FkbM family methyltransferase